MTNLRTLQLILLLVALGATACSGSGDEDLEPLDSAPHETGTAKDVEDHETEDVEDHEPKEEATVKPTISTCITDKECTAPNSYCIENDSGAFECTVIKTKNDGEPCKKDDDCTGGTCLRGKVGQTTNDGKELTWKDGYCTTLNCKSRLDCANYGQMKNNFCLFEPGKKNSCVRTCESDDECREGYICDVSGQTTRGVCRPGERTKAPVEDPPTESITDLTSLHIEEKCADVKKDEAYTFEFTLPASTKSYFINTSSKKIRGFHPWKLKNSHGEVVEFYDYSRLLYGFSFYENHLPILIPQDPRLKPFVKPGKLEYTVIPRTDQNLCAKVYAETTAGTDIDLNVYLVGVTKDFEGTIPLTVEDARVDPELSKMFKKVSETYEAKGYRLNNIRYYTLPEKVVKQFQIIRPTGSANADQLVVHSQNPGNSINARMSLNVFLVKAMSYGGAIGMSIGLPGNAGEHHTEGTGVVFTSEFLRGDRYSAEVRDYVKGYDYTAIVMAHEIGHFLGLFHTTEQDGSHDPLDDTPHCSYNMINRRPYRCGDWKNLMFPYAGISHTEITDQQAEVMGASPLTKDLTSNTTAP